MSTEWDIYILSFNKKFIINIKNTNINILNILLFLNITN